MDKKSSGVHFGWLTANIDTYTEGTEDGVIQRYARSCLWHMDDDLFFSNLIQFLCNLVRWGMTMAYGCRVQLFGWEREHHILVATPESLLVVGRHNHV
jgi:hypothetical protein